MQKLIKCVHNGHKDDPPIFDLTVGKIYQAKVYVEEGDDVDGDVEVHEIKDNNGKVERFFDISLIFEKVD